MITHIEEAIKARIAGANLPYLRTVASYGGQFDAGLDEVVRRLPAVWVAMKSEAEPKPTGTSRTVWHVPATWLVAVASRSIQNEEATRQGGVNVGTYQMLADTRALLLMQDFGLPIQELQPGRTTSLFNGKLRTSGLSIFVQEWHTKYPLEIRREGGEARYPELAEPPKNGAAPPAGPGRGRYPAPNLDGTSLPRAAPLPDFSRIGMNYFLKPPAAEDGEPDITDLLTLQGKV